MAKNETTLETAHDPRWIAVVNRDRAADGSFFYSVRTTGVYCRPSCASRRPNPANVRFHTTAADAIAAGFRACRRCRPDEAPLVHQHAVRIAAACRLIERSDAMPSLAALARHAGFSPYHFHRLFKSITGVTPRAYGAAHRARRLRRTLRQSRTVTEAIYESGFNSSGRFYDQSSGLLGMTPSDFRAGGADARIRFAVAESSLGTVLIAQSAIGVCGIHLGDDADTLVRELQDTFPNATFVGDDPAFNRVVAAVVACVESPGASLALPLDVRGTAFQQRVWQALRAIPAGTTATYAEIASRIGASGGARAVARACAANSLAVAIPCHRVVRADGALSGYRWGVKRKQTLLARERGL